MADIAGNDGHAGLVGSLFHGINYLFKVIDRESFFYNQRITEIFRHCAAHRQIVYRTADGQLADVAAGEEDGAYHVAVRGKRGSTFEIECGTVIHPVENRIAEHRYKHIRYQLMAEASAAAVA
jgi:hypothetical protein